jgi:hypothetical protein
MLVCGADCLIRSNHLNVGIIAHLTELNSYVAHSMLYRQQAIIVMS